MRPQVSPSTGRRYPLTLSCRVYGLSLSSGYAVQPVPRPAGAGKRGPKTAVSDLDQLTAIRQIRAASPFHGEGYRKVRARLAHAGLRVGGKRVLRLMRQYQLVAPRRLGPPNGNPAQDGHIHTDRPNVMWDTDATRLYTTHEGWCRFFGAVDHHTGEVVGRHVAKRGDRWAALQPLREGVRVRFAAFAKEIARGLQIRCDWGPPYIAAAWIQGSALARDEHLDEFCRRAPME